MSALVALALIAAVLVWLLAPGRRATGAAEDRVEPSDEDELAAAEREVRDLEVGQRPDDGFEGDDWGPGAGKHRGDAR
jgi:hypothetical protein